MFASGRLLTDADLAALATVPSGGFLVGAWRTALIDLLTPGFYGFVMPLVAGARFVMLGTPKWEFNARTGAATSNLTTAWAQGGVDVAGFTGNNTTAAVINVAAAPIAVNVGFSGAPMFDMTTDVPQIHVSASPTGCTVLNGHCVLSGYYTT